MCMSKLEPRVLNYDTAGETSFLRCHSMFGMRSSCKTMLSIGCVSLHCSNPDAGLSSERLPKMTHMMTSSVYKFNSGPCVHLAKAEGNYLKCQQVSQPKQMYGCVSVYFLRWFVLFFKSCV